jgi:hypothetical protein
MQWERIESQGRLVYWRLPLATRIYGTIKRQPDGYHWALRGPDYDPTTRITVIRAEGLAPNWARAKAEAEARVRREGHHAR